MIKTVNISLEQLEDLRTHLIQKQIDIETEIDLLKHQLNIAKQLFDAISILVYQKLEEK